MMIRTKIKAFAAALALWACLAATAAHASERALVLPLQPATGTHYDGLGPAVQNVIENVLALHPGIEETYLMRHIREVFPDAGEFQAFLRGQRREARALAAAVRQGARYVFHGVVLPGLSAEVTALDTMTGKSVSSIVPIDPQAGLLGMRQAILELLGQALAEPFPPGQAAKALAPEAISIFALRNLGLSYGAYMMDAFMPAKANLGMEAARRALVESGNSYLVTNMIAWQLFAVGDLLLSESLFRQALRADPSGIDALDGMMQCAFRKGGFDQALPWALRKARARAEDTGPALSSLALMTGHRALEARNLGRAISEFRTAASLDPFSEIAAFNLSMALEAAGRRDQALAPLDKRLSRPANPAMRAMVINFKARVARWMAGDARRAGKAEEARKLLDLAVTLLKQSPLPDVHEYSLSLQALSVMAMEAGDPRSAEALLKLILPDKDTDPLLIEAMLARARAQANRMDEARDTARACMNAVAERERTIEPVPAGAYLHLGKALEMLGENTLAGAVNRRADADPRRAAARDGAEG